MDFSFSQEQRLLRSSLQACLRQHADFASHQRAVQAGNAWRPELWQALADQLGVLGLGLRDDSEPLADNAQNTMIVMEELGRALAIEPYLDVAIVAGYLLGRCETRFVLAGPCRYWPGARRAATTIFANRPYRRNGAMASGS